MNAGAGVNSRATLKSGFAALTVGGTCSPASASDVRTMVKTAIPTSILPPTPKYRVVRQQACASTPAQIFSSLDECCIMPSTTRTASSNIAVGERGIRHKFAPSRRAPPASQNIVTLDSVLCLIGTLQAGAGTLPVAAVEGSNRHRFDGFAVDASRVHAHAVRVRPRSIKRFHAALGTERVLRDTGVEGVGGQIAAAGDEHKLVRRNDQMQEAKLAADRAVAVRHFEPRGRRHFEADSSAVAST